MESGYSTVEKECPMIPYTITAWDTHWGLGVLVQLQEETRGREIQGTVPGEVIGTPVVHVPVILSLFYELGTGLFKDTHTH